MNLWKNFTRFLFDPTAAEQNKAEDETILRDVLATRRPKETFADALSRVLEQREPGSSFNRVHYFKRFLRENRRREDRTADLFTVAGHVLEDLPNIYRLNAGKR